jgi:hypothetical protein
VKLVGAALCGNVDLAGGVTELSRVDSALDFELLQHVYIGQDEIGIEIGSVFVTPSSV